ncbi:MAG: quinone oxidoreductase family protein [Acidimicrobiales bacterium]
MRTTAAQLVVHGEPLVVEEVELPAPADGESVVEMAYAGVNPVDRYHALGRVAPATPLPRTLGAEGVGRLDGRWVVVHGHGLGSLRDGTWADAAVVPVAATVEVPAGVGPLAAAAMGVAGVTAWRTVTELGRVTAEDRVLVLGASGGVGSMIVSLARSIGATVWGQTGSDAKAPGVRSHGASHVVVAGTGDLARAVADLRPTVVFDPLGAGYTGAAVEAMAPHGRLVTFGTSAETHGTLPLQSLYRKGLTVIGYGGLIEPEEAISRGIAAALGALASGRLEATVDSVLPLAQVGEAFDRIAGRRVQGKLVLDLRA